MDGNIKGLHHAAIKLCGTEEYKKALAFYRDVLGLEVLREWGEGANSACMLGTGRGRVELFANAQSGLPQGNIRHLAFDVRDTDALCAAVSAAGYEVFDGPRDVMIPSDPPYPARIAFCRGPAGEEIEFFCEK